MFNVPLFSFPTLSTAFKVIVCLMYSGWHGLGGPLGVVWILGPDPGIPS